MFTARLVLASLQGHLGLFISFIGFAHLETTIAENTILREYKLKEYYLFEECLCWDVSRRVVRSECTMR